MAEFTLPGPECYGRYDLADYCDSLHASEISSFRDSRTGLHVIWRYRDVRAVLLSQGQGITTGNALDPLTPRRRLLATPRTWPSLAYLLPNVRRATANADAAGRWHGRVRRTVWDPDHPASLHPARAGANFGDLVATIAGDCARDLTGQAAVDGQADAAAGFAAPMAARVICAVLGLQPGEAENVRVWADAQASLLGQTLEGPQLGHALEALTALARACAAVIADRRWRPGLDLASLLAAGGNPPLPSRRAASAAMNLLAAGYITTYGTIINSLACLLSGEGREHWLALDDPAARPGLIQELLRTETALIGWKRLARRETVLSDGKTVIPAGSQILALIGVANRDPAVFAQPHRIDPGRPAGRALTFGAGAHLCLGRELARIELEWALRSLRAAAPAMTCAGAAPMAVYRQDPMFRVQDSLPVTVAEGGQLLHASGHGDQVR